MCVSVRNFVLGLIGILLGLWMGAGRWIFGIGGELTWWYVPFIGVPFAWLQIWMVRRLRIAERKGRTVGRASYVTMALAWACALAFGLTVPDLVNGELVSIAGYFGGVFWNEMSIALCNPFGIIAFAMIIASLVFAGAAGRDRGPTEDDILDAAEAAEAGMVRHPLADEK